MLKDYQYWYRVAIVSELHHKAAEKFAQSKEKESIHHLRVIECLPKKK